MIYFYGIFSKKYSLVFRISTHHLNIIYYHIKLFHISHRFNFSFITPIPIYYFNLCIYGNINYLYIKTVGIQKDLWILF